MTVVISTADTGAAPKLVALPKQTNAADLARQVADGAVTYYRTLAEIDAAKYGRKLLQAQAQGEIAQARGLAYSQGIEARDTLPPRALLIGGGLALAALLLLRR